MVWVTAKRLHRGATHARTPGEFADFQALLLGKLAHPPAPESYHRFPLAHGWPPSHRSNALRVGTLTSTCANAARICRASTAFTALPRSHQSTTIGLTPAARANCT